MRHPLACLTIAAILGGAAYAAVPPESRIEQLREELSRRSGSERLPVLSQLSRALRDSGVDEAVQVAEETIAIARALEDQSAEADALVDLAVARRGRGEYLLALDAGNRALQIATATGNVRTSAHAHNILGLVENSRDEPAAGLRHSLEELRIFEGLGERVGLSQSLNNVGNSYRRLGEHEKALEHHRRSLAIKVEVGDRNGAGFSHHNIGEVFSDQGLHSEALESFARAEKEWQAVGNRRALAAALKSEGLALEALGRLGQARERLQASLELRRDPPNPRGEVETLLSLGRVQLRLGRDADAVKSYTSALDTAEKLDQTSLIGDALAGLATAEAARGNVLAAGGLLEKQVALQRRMREQERSRIRSEMRATLDAHDAERRAALLEQEAALQDEQLRRGRAERNMAIVAATLLLATALIAAYGFRMKRRSEQRFRRQAEDLEVALTQVRTLRGLLPLCAWCHRRVRDDEGQWGDFEAFVQEHTDAVVTHTICPDCQATNFPKPPGGAVTPSTG